MIRVDAQTVAVWLDGKRVLLTLPAPDAADVLAAAFERAVS